MAALRLMLCNACDGTGYYADTFDMPEYESERIEKAIETGVIDNNQYTKSGYKLDKNKTCVLCEGKKYIVVTGH